MKQQILSAIESYSIITIFRHGHPDHDALGSQFGLCQFLLDNYPDKQVYCLGNESMNTDLYPESDSIDDQLISKSLAIVVDTAGKNRVDDDRFELAKMKIRIDHHPQYDDGYDFEYVDASAGSCSEILAELMIESNKIISDKTAEILLRGIISDTLGFRTTNTTAHSLKMASVLAEKNIDLPEINRQVFDTTKERYELSTEFRKRASIHECGLVTLILDKDQCRELNISSTKAKELVTSFSGVKDFEIWCVFAQNEQGMYEGSLRSRKIVINDVVSLYGGGGHQNACGIKGLTIEKVDELIESLKERLSDVR